MDYLISTNYLNLSRGFNFQLPMVLTLVTELKNAYTGFYIF